MHTQIFVLTIVDATITFNISFSFFQYFEYNELVNVYILFLS